MFKFKKLLIILCSIIFLLTALTFYINKIIFPQLIKKIAIQRIEETIKRKVEIGNIHFNWVKGFIIDRIKIYEKDSNTIVFAQAEQVSFGIIIFPGLKHPRITIPYINVQSPSVHLIRFKPDSWNFSDLFAPMPTTKSSKLQIAWGGITISDGKLKVDDLFNGRQWSEFFDNINLKLSLSYKGISYAFTADIPQKNGFVGATVYYQPLNQTTQAQIRLKNIDTASYLSLMNIPDVHLDSGIIKDINLSIDHSQEKTSARGDILMKDLNITNQEQNFKGDIEIRGLDAQYQNGDITARGQMALNNVQTISPEISTGGSVQTTVNAFEFTKEGLSFSGDLHAQNIFVKLKDRLVQVDGVDLNNIRVRKSINGIQSVGNIATKGLFIQWPHEKLEGDITLKAVTLQMKDENNIFLNGELEADNFISNIDHQSLSSAHIHLEDIQLKILDQKNFFLNSKISLNEMRMVFGRNILSFASLKTDKFLFALNEDTLKASTIFSSSDAKIDLNNRQSIEADPQIELTFQMPLNDMNKLRYKGSITTSNAHCQGFSPFQNLNNVELDTDFQNDEATINALSVNILDTNVHVTGTIKNFKKPYLNITADADDLNLAKIKDLAPELVHQYGLSFNGSSFVKIKFEGLASDPLSGKILAVASVKNASVTSNKLHQQIKNITGIIEATPNSLQWRDTTANFMGKHYSLSGSLRHFKNPRILLTLEGPNLDLKADIVKNNDLASINSISGQFFRTTFESKGSIAFYPDKEPFYDINTTASLTLENLIKNLPVPEQKNIQLINPVASFTITANLKGRSLDWKKDSIHATITSPLVTIMNYKLEDAKIDVSQEYGKINNLTLDGKFYEGVVHAVGSLDLLSQGMPYDLALNIDNTDLHQLKMDSPLKMNEIDGKFYFTSLVHGTLTDFKNNVHATGSLAIRDGFLGEFNLFKGLLDVLNDAMSLGKITITGVEDNFSIDHQKISTDNLRLKGPTIVLLGKGWVNFDQICDLNMSVDLSSGVVPAVAHDVLKSLNIHIYDKISNPKFGKKISVPQVINTLLKNLWQ